MNPVGASKALTSPAPGSLWRPVASVAGRRLRLSRSATEAAGREGSDSSADRGLETHRSLFAVLHAARMRESEYYGGVGGGVSGVRVLHVTECFAGGVAKAITKITQLADATHFLLYSGGESPSADAFTALTIKLPRNPLAAIRAIQKANLALRPNVIHAHSSWAGVYSRLAGVETPIIYEPHCYKFDDPDQPIIARRGFFLAERSLASRAHRVAVLSKHEGELTRMLREDALLHYIPNAPSIVPDSETPSTGFRLARKVVMAGRICKQKSPGFFRDVAMAVKGVRSDIKFEWIGDGDAGLRSELEQSEIAVTGWVSGKELSARYAEPFLYFHSASYEGFPLSILEAASFEHPIVAREIPALEGLGIPCATTVDDCARVVLDCLARGDDYDRAVSAARSISESMNDATQAASLAELYGYYA